MPGREKDSTFDDLSLYGSTAWAAATLGRSYNWFIERRDQLVLESGFPNPDAVTGHYIKADVVAWIKRRRQIADKVAVVPPTESSARINNDAL